MVAKMTVIDKPAFTPEKRPDEISGVTQKIKVGCGTLYVTINEDVNKKSFSSTSEPFEVFVRLGKAGRCAASQTEAISRLVSYILRCGGKTSDIIKHLKGISCHTRAVDEDASLSCADGIAKALEIYFEGKQGY